MFEFLWSEYVISLVFTDGSDSLKCSFRAGNDLSISYVFIHCLSGVTDGSDFTLSVDDNSNFNTLEASLWKILF